MPLISILGTKQKIAALLNSAGIEEPMREASYILSAALGQSRAQLMALDEIDVVETMPGIIDNMARRRASREPLARILGRKEFWGMEFGLNDHTLVPRPDTETLVSAVLETLPDKNKDYRILDLGTGTGCILLALLSELPSAQGIGADLAPEAVQQAMANAATLKLADRATFIESDWFDKVEGKFDIIVSNPPYIGEGEIFALQPEVRKHDPHLALFAGLDSMSAYQLIIPAALARLNPGGLLALEFGQGQAEAVGQIVAAQGDFSVDFKDDLGGITRVILTQPR